MSYELQAGDNIRFTRIIQPHREVRHRTDYATGRAIVVPEIPEQVLPQAGEGQIIRIIDAPRKVSGQAYRVARVAAGAHLGIVTAVIDDAVLVAKPLAMFDMQPTDKATPNVYGADAKGIA